MPPWTLLTAVLILFPCLPYPSQGIPAPLRRQDCPHTVIAGYYGSWAAKQDQPITPEDIDGRLFTHPIYAFAAIHPVNASLVFADPALDDVMIPRFVSAMRAYNPCSKPLLSIGGATFSATTQTRALFATVTTDPAKRQALIQSILTVTRRYNFFGVDLDWEFPGDPRVGGTPRDQLSLYAFVTELRSAVTTEALVTGQDPLLITLAVPCSYPLLQQGFLLRSLTDSVDWFHVMSYDMSGSWMTYTAPHVALYPTTIQQPSGTRSVTNSIDTCVQVLLSQDVSPQQLVLGIAAYARTWGVDRSMDVTGSVSGLGFGLLGNASSALSGPRSRESGVLWYSELTTLCFRLYEGDSTSSLFSLFGSGCGGLPEGTDVGVSQLLGDLFTDNITASVYGVYGNTWVSFDTPGTVGLKAEYMMSVGLRGGFVWSVNSDDIILGGSQSLQRALYDGLSPNATFPLDLTSPDRVAIVTIRVNISMSGFTGDENTQSEIAALFAATLPTYVVSPLVASGADLILISGEGLQSARMTVLVSCELNDGMYFSYDSFDLTSLSANLTGSYDDASYIEITDFILGPDDYVVQASPLPWIDSETHNRTGSVFSSIPLTPLGVAVGAILFVACIAMVARLLLRSRARKGSVAPLPTSRRVVGATLLSPSSNMSPAHSSSPLSPQAVFIPDVTRPAYPHHRERLAQRREGIVAVVVSDLPEPEVDQSVSSSAPKPTYVLVRSRAVSQNAWV